CFVRSFKSRLSKLALLIRPPILIQSFNIIRHSWRASAPLAFGIRKSLPLFLFNAYRRLLLRLVVFARELLRLDLADDFGQERADLRAGLALVTPDVDLHFAGLADADLNVPLRHGSALP